MSDGATKPIESVEEGDEVLGFDAESGATRPSRVLSVHPPKTVGHYFIINRMMRMSGTQPVYSGGKWVEVQALVLGDVLTGADGVAMPVYAIERVDEPVTVFNIEVAGSAYVAYGTIAHNKDHWYWEAMP